VRLDLWGAGRTGRGIVLGDKRQAQWAGGYRPCPPALPAPTVGQDWEKVGRGRRQPIRCSEPAASSPGQY